MPALAAEATSRQSVVSTRAQVSSLFVAAAQAESKRLVLPEEGAPTTSVIRPQGSPPERASTSFKPVEIKRIGCFEGRRSGVNRAAISAILCFTSAPLITSERLLLGATIMVDR